MTASSSPRIPLNTLAIGFGLAGFAGVWSTASELLGVPGPVAEVFWLIAAIAWVWLIVAHLVRGFRSDESLGSQLRHPAQGPIAALLPIVGMMLGANLFTLVPVAGTVLVVVSIAASALFAAWILSFWASGGLDPKTLHPGYLFPTVASGLVAAASASAVGLHPLAVVVFPLLLARLALMPALPDPLLPTLAILLAPPAVAGIAWFAMVGIEPDPLSIGFLGLLVLLLLMQFALIPRYLRLPFSIGFWSFTFPLAAATRYGIEWLSIAAFPGWQVAAFALVAVIAVLVGGVGIRSIVLVVAGRRSLTRAESELAQSELAQNELAQSELVVADRIEQA
jgi:tellurite resistance protein